MSFRVSIFGPGRPKNEKNQGFYILAHFNLKIGESLCQRQATFAALDRHVYQSEDDVTLAEGFLLTYIQ